MLRQLIAFEEKRRLSRDTNRKVLPFEWGLEFLGLRDGHGNPRQTLEAYVDRAMKNSDEFFRHTSPSQYSFDGFHLRFPSQVETPSLENNTVHARYFPATYGSKHPRLRPAVIVMPQWNGDIQAHVALSKLFARFGISALRLSLPYHDWRKPAELERSDYMVCSNVGRTLQASLQAILDVRRAADWLQQQGYNRLAVMGTSIGSSVAFLTFAHDARFDAAIFNHGSSYFGDVVWTGITTQHVRKGLETELTQEELRRFWSPISPFPFIQKLKTNPRKMLLISAKYDLSFLPEFSADVFREYHAHKIPVEIQLMPCGHYTLGEFPFSWFIAARMIRFLRKSLLSGPAA
ncbi:MAG: prolyl oligopeptidase family serine peptidase [Acidobacteriia bacterium]|nr:prolyl oligopeptidase family serine peptidase [Terriglobia bacterium]